ncbi:MAG: phage terminase large subunit [Bradymonadaceae bacterium]
MTAAAAPRRKYARALDEKAARQSRENLLTFVEYTFPGDYRVNWHHRYLARTLELWQSGAIPRLQISMPARHGKTQQASIHLPAWIMGVDPGYNIIGTSRDGRYAKGISKKVEKLVRRERYQRVFPEVRVPDYHRNFVELPDGSKRDVETSKKKWGTSLGTTYEAFGAGQGISGVGGRYILVEDPYGSRKEAQSQSYRQEVIEWYEDDLRERFQNNARALVIHTRWHQNDLMGHLQRKAQEQEEADDWVVLSFPGYREPGYEASVDWVGTGKPPEALQKLQANIEDPRDMGEPLWPYRRDADYFEADKNNPRKFYSMHQCEPRPPGGSIIKEEWLGQRWSDEGELPLHGGQWVQSWDLRAGGSSEQSSYAVGQLWATPNDKERVYLVDQVRGHWSINETLDKIQQMARQPLWKRADGKLIERKADGRAVIPMLQDRVGGIVGIDPEGSKKARLEAVSPYFAGGNVYLPDEAEWLTEYLHELKTFPGAKQDDQVDATSQALRYLFGLNDDDSEENYLTKFYGG